MTNGNTRSMARLRRELAHQDAQWARAREQLRALGDVTISVPDEVLEAIDRVCAPRAPSPPLPPPGAFACRG